MRLLKPSALVFSVALLASLAVHLPVYEALGVLVEVMREREALLARRVINFELADLSDQAARGEPVGSRNQEAKPVEPPKLAPPEPNPPKPEPPVVEPRRPEPKPMIVQLVPAPPESFIQALPEVKNKLAVKQRSDNPDVPPPENARFIAKENRRVEEETVATARNMFRDDANPSPMLAPGVNTGELGGQEESESADLEDREGSRERTPTAREAEAKPQGPSQPSAGKRDALAMAAAPLSGAGAPSSAGGVNPRAGSPEAGGQERSLVIDDGLGAFSVSTEPPGIGPGDQGGRYRPGAQAEKRGDADGSRKSGAGANLKLSWSQFEETFGSEQLREQREAYLRQRHSGVRGGSDRRWKEFRAAIENFVTDVKPGNQTALNAAASPFAEFISEAHRRIHREFAYRFIQSLPAISGPFADPSLNTTLEIVFNRDGSIHRIGIVKSSGFLPFDYGAFEAVMRAQPYPEPPPQILSGDGRVYVHWGFYRNPRLCGTFNVEPFILPNPPGTPRPDQGPLKDPGGS